MHWQEYCNMEDVMGSTLPSLKQMLHSTKNRVPSFMENHKCNHSTELNDNHSEIVLQTRNTEMDTKLNSSRKLECSSSNQFTNLFQNGLNLRNGKDHFPGKRQNTNQTEYDSGFSVRMNANQLENSSFSMLRNVNQKSILENSALEIQHTIQSRKQSAQIDQHSSELKKKKISHKCSYADCSNIVVSYGRCIRHGGGRRCIISGCANGAKVKGKCWKHGGAVLCTVDGCTRGGKAKGKCWAHGGGKLCLKMGCKKVGLQGGFCWAHGGGKRCRVPGCAKPCSAKTNHYCTPHFIEMKE